MTQQHIFSIYVGDYYGNGHGKFYRTTYTFNCSPKKLKESYKKGTEILGDSLTDYCEDYGDMYIPLYFWKKLAKHKIIKRYDSNIDPEIDFDDDNDWDDYDNYCTENNPKNVDKNGKIRKWKTSYLDYTKYYLGICKLGFPKLDYKEHKSPNIKIGGYGLWNKETR